MPYSGIIHGTEGADPFEIFIVNKTSVSLDCRAALAHWYSEELGRVAAGNQLTLKLWHDSKTGVLNLMNATDDRMPVEAIWCTTNTARIRLNLPMMTGNAKRSLRLTCHASGDTDLRCDAADG